MDNNNSRFEVSDCSDPTRPKSSGGGARGSCPSVAVDEEEKKVVFEKVISDAGGDKVEETEIVDDNKRRSLSNLFKENEKGKEPTESDDAPAEQEKPETSESNKPTEPEVPKEEPPAPPAAPPAAEPKTSETLEEKKPVQTETKTTETAGEKKPEETR
ncbi:neurofilament heavy polypeptide [Salix suchowensis]|nr:neurofilament heavy polypeptide [Salix suchowensis]